MRATTTTTTGGPVGDVLAAVDELEQMCAIRSVGLAEDVPALDVCRRSDTDIGTVALLLYRANREIRRLRLGAARAAIEEAEAVVARCPDLPKQVLWWFHFTAGDVHDEVGNGERGADHYRRAERLVAGDSSRRDQWERTVANLVYCYRRLGDNRSALEAITYALSFYQSGEVGLNLLRPLSDSILWFDNPEGAARLRMRILRHVLRDPDERLVRDLRALATALGWAGRPDEAAACFARAIAAIGRYGEATVDEAVRTYENAARFELDRGDVAAARRHLDSAGRHLATISTPAEGPSSSSGPESRARLDWLLADCEWTEGRPERALALLCDASLVTLNHWEQLGAVELRARCHEALGQWREATAAWEEALPLASALAPHPFEMSALEERLVAWDPSLVDPERVPVYQHRMRTDNSRLMIEGSKELRTPLATLQLGAEIADRPGAGDFIVPSMRAALTELRLSSAHYIGQIQRFDGRGTTDCQLPEIVNAAREMVAPIMRDRGITIAIEVLPVVVPTSFDVAARSLAGLIVAMTRGADGGSRLRIDSDDRESTVDLTLDSLGERAQVVADYLGLELFALSPRSSGADISLRISLSELQSLGCAFAAIATTDGSVRARISFPPAEVAGQAP